MKQVVNAARQGFRIESRSMLLLRPEFRYDHSSEGFFTKNGNFRSKQEQWTAGTGITYLF